MISHLKISNYALIEHLEIDFSPGFITLTGETGAGKSILMGALSLILGQRADTTVLFSKEQKCIVEGEFRIDERLRGFFEEHDLDFDTETVIRREILPGGKSRAFVNDTPVNLSALKALGSRLVDIHSQHQNLQLNDQLYQLHVVDHVRPEQGLLGQYKELYQAWRKKQQERETLQNSIDQVSQELDYLKFQFEELDKAKLSTDELGKLEEETNRMEHVEEIKLALSRSAEILQGEAHVLDQVNEMIGLIRKLRDVHKESAGFHERLESAYIELKDLAAEMDLQAMNLEYDPKQLEQGKARMDLLYSLLQKYRCEEVSELIKIRDSLDEKIQSITFSDEQLGKLDRELETLHARLVELARKISEERKQTAGEIEKQVAGMLRELGIPNAAFSVRVLKLDQPGPEGMDEVKFLFSANKQSPPEEISKVASGGEISRLMLSIKSLLSGYKGQPTLIFDEIDSGVSGEIAEKMGAIMKGMSNGRQVIAITHLPQVAAQGEEHFLVYKQDEEHSTVTRLRKLSPDDRIVEIAKLLSGEKVTDAALSNARELLKQT